MFPAHAGMIPGGARAVVEAEGVPRTRGDDPVVSEDTTAVDKCSPHTRG